MLRREQDWSRNLLGDLRSRIRDQARGKRGKSAPSVRGAQREDWNRACRPFSAEEKAQRVHYARRVLELAAAHRTRLDPRLQNLFSTALERRVASEFYGAAAPSADATVDAALADIAAAVRRGVSQGK